MFGHNKEDTNDLGTTYNPSRVQLIPMFTTATICSKVHQDANPAGVDCTNGQRLWACGCCQRPFRKPQGPETE